MGCINKDKTLIKEGNSLYYKRKRSIVVSIVLVIFIFFTGTVLANINSKGDLVNRYNEYKKQLEKEFDEYYSSKEVILPSAVIEHEKKGLELKMKAIELSKLEQEINPPTEEDILKELIFSEIDTLNILIPKLIQLEEYDEQARLEARLQKMLDLQKKLENREKQIHELMEDYEALIE